jgi:hypothetical protein
MNNKNLWGASNLQKGIDQQRADLFRVSLNLPSILGDTGGALGNSIANTFVDTIWNTNIMFAVEKFPFPPRGREMIATKYLNQTNNQLGADSAPEAVDIPVRYAFNQTTAEWLEKWHWITSNPRTGGVALTSAVKTNGVFTWLVPDMNKIKDLTTTSDEGVLKEGGKYILEGCLIKNLKPGVDADMTQSNQGVVLTFTLVIDRYYPETPSALTIPA